MRRALAHRRAQPKNHRFPCGRCADDWSLERRRGTGVPPRPHRNHAPERPFRQILPAANISSNSMVRELPRIHSRWIDWDQYSRGSPRLPTIPEPRTGEGSRYQWAGRPAAPQRTKLCVGAAAQCLAEWDCGEIRCAFQIRPVPESNVSNPTAPVSSGDPAPYHLLAKPAGAACNLSCKYCFFLSKEALYPDDHHLMDEWTLEVYLRQLFVSSPGSEVQVAWQGGEPMLRGLRFYRRSVELADRFRKPHQTVRHTIQTNGVLVTDEWAAFFKANGILVGLSIDGPRKIHDTYRIDKKGRGSYDDVLRAWQCLRKHDVDVNILCTIHAGNAAHGLECYRFFRDELGAQYIQLIPIVERASAATIATANRGWDGPRGVDRPLYKQEGNLVTERSVPPEKFGSFLIEIFDEWVKKDVGQVFVTTFDVALGSWLGQHSLCIVAPTCGRSLALEHNGDVYSCDHYVEPGHKLGNIHEQHIATLVASEQQRRFGSAKSDTLPAYCRKCPVLFACYGECPRNRFLDTPGGEAGLNYLCAGYKAFFLHIRESMAVMARLIQLGRFADEIVGMTQNTKDALLRPAIR